MRLRYVAIIALLLFQSCGQGTHLTEEFLNETLSDEQPLTNTDNAPSTNSYTHSTVLQVDTPIEVLINYDSSKSGPANTCQVSQLSNVLVQSSCVCINGICKVGLSASSAGTASISFSVKANGLNSNVSTLTFVVDSTTPVLVENNILNVVKLSSAVFKNNPAIPALHLYAIDAEDTAENITYTVKSLPTTGTLRVTGVPAIIDTLFTQEQVNTGQVTYDNTSGSTGDIDQFTFIVADSSGKQADDAQDSSPATFQIIIVDCSYQAYGQGTAFLPYLVGDANALESIGTCGCNATISLGCFR